MFRRYYAEKDTTITNAYERNLIDRVTGSNTGLADVIEIFHIYAQQSSASMENSRALIQFPIDQIAEDRTNSIIPASGSCAFYLKLYNAEHPFTLPKDYNLYIVPVSRSWTEGDGIDIDSYVDYGWANWETAYSSSVLGEVSWTNTGGDYHNGVYYNPGVTLPQYTSSIYYGPENLEINITSLVEEWIGGITTGYTSTQNYGIGLYMQPDIDTYLSSYYTKKFYSRSSEYFFKRPVIEVRWEDSYRDDRGRFYNSSSLLNSTQNTNKLFLYNFFRGQLVNIPSSSATGEPIYVNMYADSLSGTLLNSTTITGSWISTGIYSASVTLYTTSSTIYDVWYSAGLHIAYATGSAITVRDPSTSFYNTNPRYFLSIPELKSEYSNDETVTFRISSRPYNWNPNIYTVANSDFENEVVDNLYYGIKRVVDDYFVVEYGTGSYNHTLCSYDVSGNYFHFDMSHLEPGYMYQLSFVKKKNSSDYEELRDKFKFRII